MPFHFNMSWESNLIYIDIAILYLYNSACFKDERIREFFRKILGILKRENINESQDFMSVFKQFNCNRKDIIKFITFFLESNNYIHFDENTVYKKRSFEQPNKYYKNFLITLIAYRHEAAFIDSIQLNHSEFLPAIDNVDAFVEEIKVKIERIKDKIKSAEPSLNEPIDIPFSQPDFEVDDPFSQYDDPFSQYGDPFSQYDDPSSQNYDPFMQYYFF